ncbi:MAG: hypothetical protein CM15mP74_16980 [Halieaceae bacterium]|nr:MAG: hypothetical protein CM15mP74_16980 [Halieaceae bacterium]
MTVSGLTNGVGYTCTVVAENAYGSSAASSATSSITPEELHPVCQCGCCTRQPNEFGIEKVRRCFKGRPFVLTEE